MIKKITQHLQQAEISTTIGATFGVTRIPHALLHLPANHNVCSSKSRLKEYKVAFKSNSNTQAQAVNRKPYQNNMLIMFVYRYLKKNTNSRFREAAQLKNNEWSVTKWRLGSQLLSNFICQFPR